MDEAGKIQALPLSVVRERLLNKRHDGFVMAHRPSNSAPEPVAKSAPPEAPAAPTPRIGPQKKRICAYSKCGVEFVTKRVDQIYHTADCRKRAWFERNFAPIAKPTEGA